MIEEEKVILRPGTGEAVQKAERAVIGSLLIDPDAIVKVSPIIQEEHFSDWRLKKLYGFMVELEAERMPADFVSVTWKIEDAGLDEEMPAHYVTELINSTPSSVYAEHYAGLVYEAYRERKLLRTLETGVQALYGDGADVDKVQAQIEAGLHSNGALDAGPEEIGEIVDRTVDNLLETAKAREEGVQIGIKFGLDSVDRIIRGLRGGDLTVLAARPGMGKTTAALQTLIRVAEEGIPATIYSLEMGADQLILKLISYYTRIPYDRLRDGEIDDQEKEMVEAAREHLRGLPITIKDDLFTFEEIREHAIRSKLRKGAPYLVVVDYIQLATLRDGNYRGNKNAEVAEISRGLKQLARRLGCPLIAVAQLNRGVEQRADKRPLLSDLRDSGAVEQDADQVIFLYRDGYYDEASETPNVLEWLIRKNRHGSTGTASTFFDLTCGQINNLELARTPLDY